VVIKKNNNTMIMTKGNFGGKTATPEPTPKTALKKRRAARPALRSLVRRTAPASAPRTQLCEEKKFEKKKKKKSPSPLRRRKEKRTAAYAKNNFSDCHLRLGKESGKKNNVLFLGEYPKQDGKGLRISNARHKRSISETLPEPKERRVF